MGQLTYKRRELEETKTLSKIPAARAIGEERMCATL
jgi:hypothetical protein